MTSYKKILLPHAGTQAGDKALRHASNIAKHLNASITILHVIEEIPLPPAMTFDSERKKWANELRKARNELKVEMYKKMDVLATKLQKQGISANVKVTHGYPDEEISRIVSQHNYNLIVMAKRRKLPGIKAILKLGSVSRKILEKVSCPVLLIDGEK